VNTLKAGAFRIGGEMRKNGDLPLKCSHGTENERNSSFDTRPNGGRRRYTDHPIGIVHITAF
jgi:hypothetical protein